jgi:hypothetical protein
MTPAAAQVFPKHGIIYAPPVHHDVTRMTAALYRNTCRQPPDAKLAERTVPNRLKTPPAEAQLSADLGANYREKSHRPG